MTTKNDKFKLEPSLQKAPDFFEQYEVVDDTKKTEKEINKTSLVPLEPLQRYLMEIRRFPLLTKEEERKLTMRYRETGDPVAAYVLITSNLRLVVKIAMEHKKSWVHNLMDLIQEGNMGLMQAVKKFDPLKGVKLSYYASFWIKAYILKYILDNWRLVKIGTTQVQRKLFFNLQKEKARLSAQGFEPDVKSLAQNLEVKEQDILDMSQRLALPEKSLEYPVDEYARESLKDRLPSRGPSIEQKLADKEARKRFQKKLAEFRLTLEGKELDIFDNRLMSEKPKTLQKIGERYGITRERTRQVETTIIDKLRRFLQEDEKDLSIYKISTNGD